MSPAGDSAPGWLRRHLATLPAALRRHALLAHVCGRAAHFLGATTPVAADASWIDLGFDSLRAVDFRSELAAALALELRSTLLFDRPQPLALVDHLLPLLELADSPGPQAPAAGRATAGEPIAIVGAACRFPGAPDLGAFWQLLAEGRDAIAPIPPERFDVDALFDRNPDAEGKLYVREAGLIDHIDRFDATLFGISPREALMLDPQQRLLLETSWHALEDANLPPSRLGQRCVGVYVGTRASEYFDSQTLRTPADASSYYPTGNAVSTAAGRLSYTFGFRGPCYALDTACSGSLVAVHIAVRALRARECDAALAGGVNAIFDPVPFAGLCRARMLAPDGRCKSFDQSANGYGRGEGCGMVVLKRLADAQADGDRVLGVIVGTSINQDGRSGGLTVPHGPSQSDVIAAAIADAGLTIDQIDYVEAHGTGTNLGDPIEVGALQAVFARRPSPLPIGSVKTNIGHLEAAAGISGLLKAVLALRHRRLPATLHFRNPNPHIDWANSNVQVVATARDLPADGALHAGISSFGFSGTNCHVVVATPPPPPAAIAAGLRCRTSPTRGPWLLPLQAADKDALRALARAHAEALAATTTDLSAWCLATGRWRAPLPARAAFVARSQEELIAGLRAFADGDEGHAAAVGTAGSPPPRVAFLFPGQGAQRAGMGKQLADDEPVFADALDAAAARLAGHLEAPLREVLGGNATHLLDRTDHTQPALCAFQLALLALFRSIGVVPDHVLGHSVGDFAAAVAAGVMDGGDALQLCAQRGRLMVELCPQGGMLVVLAPLAAWQHLLAGYPHAAIAVRNAPANTAVGGDPAELQRLHAQLTTLGIHARLLPVSHAFHTAHTDPMLAPFAEQVARRQLRPPARGFVDCRTGTLADAGIATAEHWRRHVRDVVQFDRGIAVLAASGCRIWVELGAQPMLANLAADNGVRDVRLISAQRSTGAGRHGFLAAVAELWSLGVEVDWSALYRGVEPDAVALPLYPLQRRRYWLPPQKAATQRAGDHALLGERVDTALLAPQQALWQARLRADAPAWLADHQALGQVLLPAAAMIETALAAEMASGTPAPWSLRGAALRKSRPLTDATTAFDALRTPGPHGASFRLSSHDEHGGWSTHFEGITGTADPTIARVEVEAVRARCRDEWSATRLYERCDALQLHYGPAFRGVRRLWRGAQEVLSEVELPAALSEARFVLHPALLDACLHAIVAALPEGSTPHLPLGVESLVVYRAGMRRGWCHLRLRETTGTSRSADLQLCDDDGEVFASLQGLQLVPADPAAMRQSAARELLYHLAWDLRPLPASGPPPVRVGLVGWPRLAAALQQLLPEGAAHVATVATLPALLATQRLDWLVYLAEPDAIGDPRADAVIDPLAAQQRLLGGAITTIQQALRVPTPPRLCLVTHGAAAAGPAPAAGPAAAASLWGLWRTVAREHAAVRPLAIDLDPVVPASAPAELAATLLLELRGPTDEPEVAWRTGQRRVARLRRGDGPGDRIDVPDEPFRVRTTAYGPFEQLACLPHARQRPRRGEVEVAITAAGLNFKDVLYARGLLRDYAERAGIRRAVDQPLGFEASGVVCACGEDVAGMQVGDRVMVLAADCLASHVTVPATAAVRLPPGIDPVAAAGVPIVFATVVHALHELAQVQSGETVLVHAAAGGVGQAAIQLLRAAGCRVLATSSAGKRAFVEALGVEVVGDSRRLDFEAGVMAATAGRGVDVVLNTLSGEGVGKSFAALARGGRFVELGKLGVWTAAQVQQSRPDVRYFAFDLGDEIAGDPTMLERLLRRVADGLASGAWRPPSATVLPLSQLRTAFAHLSKGQHVGKVVVRVPTATGALRRDRSYLLTGASGGTAPAIMAALVAAGAQHLALLARSGIDPQLLSSLRRQGIEVCALQADVADRDALAAALTTLRSTLPPLGGIVHAAGALADSLLVALDWPRVATTIAAKVAGAILLDELTAQDPLDFFVATSSMAGTLGNPGQAAYAAANTFLDAFAAARRARGAPGAAIAFGPWDGGGMASRLDERLRARLRQHGVTFVPAATAAQLLVEHRNAVADLAVLPVRWADWLAPYGDQVPPPWRELRPSNPTRERPVERVDLQQLPSAERQPALRRLVRQHIAAVLGFAEPDQLDGERTFRDLGLDSLLAVDAKTRLERVTGLTLPATLLFDYPDLERLVAHLLGLAGANATPAPSSPTAPATDDDVDVAQLDTQALARALAAELRDLRRPGDPS